MKINLNGAAAVLLSAILFFLSSCSQVEPRFEHVLGTVCFVNLYEGGKEAYYDEIFARLQQIHGEFSFAGSDSDIKKLREADESEPVVVSDDAFTVLQMAQRISEISGGAFDISIEPIVSLWKVNTDSPHVATKAELDSLLPLVDYRNIILNPEDKSVRLLKKGVEIDFGGIAKGFAADEIVKICKKHKIRRAVIDLGGNVYVYGKKKKTNFWNVGIKNPEYPDSAPLIKLTVPEISVVTSGTYERFFNDGEKRYHHILSPKDGWPVENELYSVSVISTNSMLADGLTTAFFVLGTERSLELLPKIQEEFQTELAAVFVQKDHEIIFSDDFPYACSILYDNWGNQKNPGE
ncbi:MAG: FAD:protein FMN transferase [Treponema sp.]|nr:FAD:protein FMN transferase [Treponema sp.]